LRNSEFLEIAVTEASHARPEGLDSGLGGAVAAAGLIPRCGLSVHAGLIPHMNRLKNIILR
jgi:hypothetical protein